MDLADVLKTTLDNTYNLAIGLEEVASMILPRKIGARSRKRLGLIKKEQKNLAELMNSHKKTFEKPLTKQTLFKKSPTNNSQNNNTEDSSNIKIKQGWQKLNKQIFIDKPISTNNKRKFVFFNKLSTKYSKNN